MPRVGIALGSNLGDRSANLATARDCLRKIAVPGAPFLTASDHATEPLLCPPGSPVFVNSVIEISYSGTATQLLEATQAIEKSLGRIPVTIRNSPRLIDIDLLYFGDEIIRTQDLILPHPRIAERPFVLAPLAEIRPHLILPGHTLSISELLSQLRS